MTGEEREVIMRAWDIWRKYIAEGGGGSWPRDEFEGLLDHLDARAEALEEENRTLRNTGVALLERAEALEKALHECEATVRNALEIAPEAKQ